MAVLAIGIPEGRAERRRGVARSEPIGRELPPRNATLRRRYCVLRAGGRRGFRESYERRFGGRGGAKFTDGWARGA